MPNVNLPKYRDLAKGFRHGNKTNKRVMVNRVDKALEHAYVSRKLKKRDSRMLWITQINAAAREQGMAYSQFANALRAAEIDLNRKVLSEMAITEPLSFRAVLEVSKAAKAAASASKAAGAPKAPA